MGVQAYNLYWVISRNAGSRIIKIKNNIECSQHPTVCMLAKANLKSDILTYSMVLKKKMFNQQTSTSKYAKPISTREDCI
jgi:hypothetical protein